MQRRKDAKKVIYLTIGNKIYMDYLTENLARWACICPDGAARLKEIGRGTFEPVSSSSDEMGEWFRQLPLEGISVLYVYGVGDGGSYVEAQRWLKEDGRRCLVFIEDNPQVIFQLLESEIGSQLVRDRQVFLYWNHLRKDDKEISPLEAVVIPFCFNAFHVAAIPVYTRDKFRRFVEIRAMLSFFSSIQKLNIIEYSDSALVFFNNFYRNLLMLPSAYQAKELFGKFQGVPAIICGAGPSLDKNIDIVASLQDRALIFAGGTAMNAVNARGIVPHFGVGIDPNPDHYARLLMNQAYEAPFLYMSRMLHSALKMVHGERVFVTGSSGYDIGRWVEEKLGIEGEAIDAGYNVLNFSLSIAKSMGCNPLILVGVDLAYSQDRSYASGIVSHPIHDRRRHFSTKSSAEALLQKKDIFGNPVRTLWKWVGESFWYTKFAGQNPDVLIVNATEGGIGFPGIENMTLAEVSERYLTKTYDVASMVHGAIQKSRMPPEVTVSKIKELLGHLSLGYDAIAVKYQELIDKLLELDDRKSPQQIETIYEEAAVKENEIYEDEIYRLILKPIDEATKSVFALELDRLKFDEGLIPRHEIILKRAKIDLKRYEGLKKTTLRHASLIRLILHQHDMDQEKIALLAKENLSKLPDRHSEKDLQGDSKKGDGTSPKYYHGGQLYSLQRYREGKPEGKQEYFYETGLPKTVMTYERGLLNGVVKLYHPNGQVFRELNYKDGKRYGFDRIWDEAGRLLIEAQFEGDQPVGAARRWYSNGTLACEMIYDDPSQRLQSKYWDEEGQPLPEVGDDYCQSFTMQTGHLTDSLHEVFSEVSKVAAAVPQAPDLGGDMEKLRIEMAKLDKLTNALKKHSNKDLINLIDQAPDPTRQQLENKLIEQNEHGLEHIMELEKELKGAFNNLLKKLQNPSQDS